jgi:large subunit ribosomal protein L9
MEVILLERISRLGSVGDTVRVRNGFARNFLLPQKKALRATVDNKAYFEAKRDVLERQNADARTSAEKQAETMQNLSVTIIRQASEDGKLYGSVAVRDIAEALAEAGYTIERRLIDLTASIKTLGVYQAIVALHPEVKLPVKVHVARNLDNPMPLEEEIVPEAETSEEDAA